MPAVSVGALLHELQFAVVLASLAVGVSWQQLSRALHNRYSSAAEGAYSCSFAVGVAVWLTSVGDGVGFFASSCVMSSLISALISLRAARPRSVPYMESSRAACRQQQRTDKQRCTRVRHRNAQGTSHAVLDHGLVQGWSRSCRLSGRFDAVQSIQCTCSAAVRCRRSCLVLVFLQLLLQSPQI